jgi:hypothetical protein
MHATPTIDAKVVGGCNRHTIGGVRLRHLCGCSEPSVGGGHQRELQLGHQRELQLGRRWRAVRDERTLRARVALSLRRPCVRDESARIQLPGGLLCSARFMQRARRPTRLRLRRKGLRQRVSRGLRWRWHFEPRVLWACASRALRVRRRVLQEGDSVLHEYIRRRVRVPQERVSRPAPRLW